MFKRREFILKSLIGSAGIAFGGITAESIIYSSNADINSEIQKDPALNPDVEAEEEVYQYIPANNGAGPMWCGGSTCIARIGKSVFASGLETVAEWKPLNNCRWILFERSKNGWNQKLADTKGRTREPSPLAVSFDGRLFLSVNPTLTSPDKENGPARPEILLFKNPEKQIDYKHLLPVWAGDPPFSEHSYRSLSSDGSSGELIIFQNIGYTHAEWSFLDSNGNWAAQGQLKWPWGDSYEKPEPIRVCYPNVMLKNRAVYFCGVSDIIEPNKAWREYKKQITGKEWDYDFRRLFFTWSDDIISRNFHPWIEIASREDTCGWITPSDMWISPDGSAHILWTERALDERLRDKFFPGAKQSYALNYAIVRGGKVEVRRTLVLNEEGNSNERPGAARFHVTPGNRLFVVYFVSGTNTEGEAFALNRILELSSDGLAGKPVDLPLKRAFSSFFTATVRAGSKPSTILDMLGTLSGVNNSIHYAKISLW